MVMDNFDKKYLNSSQKVFDEIEDKIEDYISFREHSIEKGESGDISFLMQQFLYNLKEFLGIREVNEFGMMKLSKEQREKKIRYLFLDNVELLSNYGFLYIGIELVFDTYCSNDKNDKGDDFLNVNDFFDMVWEHFFRDRIYGINNVPFLGKEIRSFGLLHLACLLDDVKIIKKVIQYGADVNIKDSYGLLPLNITKKNKKILADVTDFKNIDGIIYEDLLRDETVSLKNILHIMKKHSDLPSVVCKGKVNLLHAILSYRPTYGFEFNNIITFLIESGVSVDDVSEKGNLPIHAFVGNFLFLSDSSSYAYKLFPKNERTYRLQDKFEKLQEMIYARQEECETEEQEDVLAMLLEKIYTNVPFGSLSVKLVGNSEVKHPFI